MGVRFKLSDTFTVNDVVIPVPNQTGGTDEMSLESVVFKRASYEACNELRKKPDMEVARDRLVSFKAVDDETGEEVVYSNDTRDALLAIPSAPYALALAFFRASQGTAAKN